jgi:hypothetical protein
LHSILFHRLFGTIKPQTFEVLDVTMVITYDINSDFTLEIVLSQVLLILRWNSL